MTNFLLPGLPGRARALKISSGPSFGGPARNFTSGPNHQTTVYVRESVLTHFGLNSNEFVYLGAYIYEKNIINNTMITYYKSLVELILFDTFVTSSLLAVIYLGYKCYYCLKTQTLSHLPRIQNFNSNYSFLLLFKQLSLSDLIKSFESSKLFFWIASPIVYSAIWMFITAVTLQGNKFTDVMLEEQVLRKQNISISEIVYIGPNYYPQKEVIDWVPILGMATLTLMIFVSIYSIIYFAAKSYIAMNKLVLTSKNSQRYKASQAQLLNALVIQAIIPFVLMHLPASAVFIMPFFSCGNQTFASIFSVTVALYPVLDPLPTIFVVKCYRVAVTRELNAI
ncbi:Protein CBR-STR-1 [Caenorhabditis briggsae]|uniref:Protein CBR-STR-1 n=1 Tax=Caenorhabditis briggsae TaxID=6238 RepID=A8X1M0_CAEBR|nr:Protein CBR-STR-1 [Caenorhabditis briggsae]CAP26530.1 Protein CBR-STR-1 [Caenorhabditis briggsae]